MLKRALAETTATINDAGAYVGVGGTGALWGDYFRYENVHSNLVQRLDARGVKTNYWYFNSSGHTDPGDGTPADPLNRLQSISWDASLANQGLLTTDPSYVPGAATVTYQYRNRATNTTCDPLDASGRKDVTQLASVGTFGISTESYCYDTEGRVASKTLKLNNRPLYPFRTDYSYDSLNRITNVTYPVEWGNGTQPRKQVHQDFDVASRLSGLKLDGVSQASSIVYNPASQATSLKVGTGTNQITESYAYEALTGLLSNQKVQRGTTTLLDLTYDYLRAGTTAGRTGQLTDISNNLDHGRDRAYEYDALGRLKKATGGSTPSWTQTYGYDRYGNRTTVTATGTADDGSAIPRDGLASLAYGATTNRITTAGWQYDAAGNQVRGLIPGSTTAWQKYQYDAANRLVKVKKDDNVTVIATYTYSDSNERLITDESGYRTYYASNGGTVIAEYSETPALPTTPKWSKSYVYLGGRLLSTLTPNGSGGEATQYHHPDRLGTRVVTDPVAGTSFEQVTLPFGTPLDAESTGATNRRFTSYDRSGTTGLDYAVNRHYNPQQGRFTQTDPIGMGAASLTNPESFNGYSYTQNDPMNFVDPTGLMCQVFYLEHTIQWVCDPYDFDFDFDFFDPFTGGGGGNGPQKPAPTQQPQPKKKCTQKKNGGDRADIEAKLREAGVFGNISNIRSAGPKNPEGILFDIDNRQSFVGAIKATRKFTRDIPIEHLSQVGGNVLNSNGFRSNTDSRDSLGPDSTGFRRSLQIGVGPAGTIPGNPRGATGYADLDCDNPDQDVWSALKHIFS